MSGTSGEMRDGSSLIMFLPVFIFTIASIATFVIGRRMLTTMRIGALREWLLVRNWRSRVAIGCGDEIVLSPESIAIEGVALPLGRSKYLMMFDREEWSQWIEPRLADAKKLTGFEILMWSWKYQRVRILAAAAAILMMLGWELMR
jgi:hypothetical protein